MKRVANIKGKRYKLATSDNESLGIDGYIGTVPVSIKPITYKTKNMYGENLHGKLIYYEKKKGRKTELKSLLIFN
ncbi:MAG: MjaI family restriction endonuclease [Deltaproteobacteria bacterium]|nr:MjaI family restriction endonuclease [Deltaproteobacteria bacterium]MBW2154835.1 MjaI family restriction endonuclease [Deltaproteobacteria bacterium]